MKLLLDQHISYKLADRLSNQFPGSSHVRLLRIERASDSDIWYYAKQHDFVLVTKDSDLVDLAVMRGSPPKIVWLRVGNVTTEMIESILREHHDAIAALVSDETRVILEIVA